VEEIDIEENVRAMGSIISAVGDSEGREMLDYCNV
jgi:hypothetical protein